ncbi:MAG: FMN-binding protein [Lutibacter sp.]|uniref:FMN-binding protein n=1 Tax=Lutibacter sp. TaxID=1925666 RepID=UPI00299CF311|nr:FMN-binding protein [Lutibacter sp.]MDX1828201.1 FMN-binding protein [Lutibacter sp.]
MKKEILFFIVLTALVAFKPINKIDKLINSEIKKTFVIDNFTIESIKVKEDLNKELPIKITDSNFKKINIDSKNLGYYYQGKAFGKVDYFDFLVIFNSNLVIKKVKILVYREDRGGEIGSKRWLKQFIGKSVDNSLKYGNDIAGISGATISAKSITFQMEKLLQSISILHRKKII